MLLSWLFACICVLPSLADSHLWCCFIPTDLTSLACYHYTNSACDDLVLGVLISFLYLAGARVRGSEGSVFSWWFSLERSIASVRR